MCEAPHHAFNFVPVMFVFAALAFDYFYLEVLMKKMCIKSRRQMWIYMCMGYSVVELIRSIPELGETIPHMAASMLQLH